VSGNGLVEVFSLSSVGASWRSLVVTPGWLDRRGNALVAFHGSAVELGTLGAHAAV